MSALQFSTQDFSARRTHSGPAIDKLLYWTKFSHTPKVHSFLKQCLLNLCLTKKSGKHCGDPMALKTVDCGNLAQQVYYR